MKYVGNILLTFIQKKCIINLHKKIYILCNYEGGINYGKTKL